MKVKIKTETISALEPHEFVCYTADQIENLHIFHLKLSNAYVHIFF